jgi:hypothetical protein
MAGTTEQNQQQLGQDRSLGKETAISTDRAADSSSRVSTEGPRLTRSESRRAAAVSKQIEQGTEQLTINKQHADLTISFRVQIDGLDPSRQYI